MESLKGKRERPKKGTRERDRDRPLKGTGQQKRVLFAKVTLGLHSIKFLKKTESEKGTDPKRGQGSDGVSPFRD